MFIYQPQRNSTCLHIYNILERTAKTVQVTSNFPTNAEYAITHVGDEVYIAGGYGGGPKSGYWDFMRRYDEDGKVTELKKIPTAMSWFPMPFNRFRQVLITVGGYDNNGALTNVREYNIADDSWSDLPALPNKLYGSGACILEPDSLYNFGGNSASHTILFLNLSVRDSWKSFTLSGQSFNGWCYREAVSIGD